MIDFTLKCDWLCIGELAALVWCDELIDLVVVSSSFFGGRQEVLIRRVAVNVR